MSLPPPTRAPADRSRWAIALLVFFVLLLLVVAVGDVLFSGASGPAPTATPTSMEVGEWAG
jgi:hypothetical protein